MKFESVIIGGGLSGLVCGISLQEKGQNCLIISSGRSALEFFSGSFNLLSSFSLEAVAQLDSAHPYSKIGTEAMTRYDKEFREMMLRAGVKLSGGAEVKHYQFSALGTLKPAWLTLEDFMAFEEPYELPWKEVTILNFAGFLDFCEDFIEYELQKRGIKCEKLSLILPFVEKLRESPSEFRSSSVARLFDKPEHVDALLEELRRLESVGEVFIMPAVFGLMSAEPMNYLKSRLDRPLCLIPTLPPSVPGIRVQHSLEKYFRSIGGIFILGDSVESAHLEKDKVKAVCTGNQNEFEAENFILSTGSFFSRGIMASRDEVYEPIFVLDTQFDAKSSTWSENYMNFGVKCDSDFRAMKNGRVLENLYTVGSVLSAYDGLKEGSGGGVAAMSAMHVAEMLVRKG